MSARNANWIVHSDAFGNYTYDNIKIALLMDIREELRIVRQRLSCAEFLTIPRILQNIQAYTNRIPIKAKRKRQ